jgi:hypothetical protein
VPLPSATARAAFRAVLVPFLASRALFALVMITAPMWIAVLHVPQTAPLTRESLLAADWYRWDAQWYMRVAVDGYRSLPYAHQHVSMAFFPLYPLALHVWFWLWPWSRVLGAMLVTNLCTLAATYYLYRLVDLEFGRERAIRAVWLLAFFPTSFFFFSGYSEGLFLLCLVLFFYQLRLGHWWQAGLWGALATLTRSLGLITFVPFLIAWFEANPALCRQLTQTMATRRLPTLRRAELLPRQLAERVATLGGAALIPGSLCAFMVYLWARFGDPLIFSDSQRSWHRTWAWPWQALQAALERPLAGFPRLSAMQWHAGLDTLWAVLFLAVTAYAVRGLPRRYVAFLALFWLVVLATPALGDGAVDPLISLPRFLLTAFPLLIFLASTPRRAGVAIALSLPLLLFNAGDFISGGWVA